MKLGIAVYETKTTTTKTQLIQMNQAEQKAGPKGRNHHTTPKKQNLK